MRSLVGTFNRETVLNTVLLHDCEKLLKGSLNDDRYYIEETNLLGAAGLLDQGEVDPHLRCARVAAPYLVWA